MPQLLTTTLNGGIDPGMAGTGSRSSYAMLSYNTPNGEGGYALFDSNWSNPINYGNSNSYNNYGASDMVYSSGGSYMNYNAMYYNGSSTSNSPSSNGTSSYINGTNAAGEFGNAMIDVYSDGTWAPQIRSSSTWTNKWRLNIAAINSDHSNKRNVYLLQNGIIRCVDRLYGNYNYPMAGTQDYTVTSLNSSMYGSASYHAGRKELTILSFSSSNGAYDVITFQNVDFNTYPSPNQALTQAGVVRVNSTVSMSSNWGVNNSESYYNLKPIVTDNGKVYVSVMFTSNNFTLYEFTRSGTSAITATYITAQSLTTSYGLDQGFYYGQRQMTSRDGSTVCTFCVYYYYGSGCMSYMINKTTNSYTAYNYTDTSYGHIPMPFGNSGWTFVYAGNLYSSNYSGGYVQATYDKAANNGSGFTQIGGNRYFTKFTAPNTTNYPGFTQTTDYMLLTGNPAGPKLAR